MKSKRFLALFMSIMMAFAFMPNLATPAYANAPTPEKTISGLGSNGLNDPVEPTMSEPAQTLPWAGSFVYYGSYSSVENVKYRVLDPRTSDYGGTTMFLDCDYILFNVDKFSDKPMISPGGVEYEAASAAAIAAGKNYDYVKKNLWADSPIRTSLNGDGFYTKDGVFTGLERNAIAASTRASHRYSQDLENNKAAMNGPMAARFQYWVDVPGATINDHYTPLTGDHIFLLDVEDVCNRAYGYGLYSIAFIHNYAKNYEKTATNGAFIDWYLRSPETGNDTHQLDKFYHDMVGYVAGYQEYRENGTGPLMHLPMLNCCFMNSVRGISPAFNVDLSKVISTSPIEGETNCHKLTLLDENLAITTASGIATESDTAYSINIGYTLGNEDGASRPSQVSYIVTNGTWNAATGWSEDADVLDYGKLAAATTTGGAFSLAKSKVSGTLGTDFNIYLVEEAVNSGKATDYASAPVKVPVRVQARATVTTAPTGRTNLTYTGEAQPLLATAGEACSGAHMLYMVSDNRSPFYEEWLSDATNYQTDIDSVVGWSGTYTIYYAAVGDDLTLSTTGQYVTVTIGPKPITPTITVPNATYGGGVLVPNVTVSDGETPLVADTDFTVVPAAENVNAGTGKVKIAPKEGGNYTFDAVTKTFTIAPMPIPVVIAGGLSGQTYTGEQLTPSLMVIDTSSTRVLDPADYTVEYGENKNAGTNAGVVTVSAVQGGNYTFEPTAAHFTIAKATPTINIREDWKIHDRDHQTVYPILNPTATFNGAPMEVNWSYESSDPTAVSVDSDGTMRNSMTAVAGNTVNITITAIAVGDAGDNFDIATKEVTVAITNLFPRNDFTVSPSVVSKTYGDADFALSTSVERQGGDVRFEVEGTDGVVEIADGNKVHICKAGTASIKAILDEFDGLAGAFDKCTVTVLPKELTIKAKDKSIKVGDTLPDISSPEIGEDYEVIGLVEGDTLIGTAVMQYDPEVPNTDVAGSAKIIIGGLAADATKYNDPVCVPGTLTITKKSSSHSGKTNGETGDNKPADTPSQQGNDAGTLTAQTTTKDGKATAEFRGNEAIETLKKLLEDRTSPNPILTFIAQSDDTANAVDVTLGSDVMQGMSEAEKAAYTTYIKTGMGDLGIPFETFKRIATQSGGKDVTFSMQKKEFSGAADWVNQDAGLKEFLAGMGKSLDGVAVDVNITAGDKNITNFGGSNLQLLMPVTGVFKEGSTYNGASVSADGTVEGLTAQCVKVDGQLYGLVNTSHLTTFVITTEEVKNPFTDVKESDYFFQPVQWAVENDVTSGLSDTVFGPNAGCTRAQMVTFLWRAAGKPWASANKHFSDVAEGAYYKDAIEWAVAAGITNGISDELFNPNGAVTREQLASFIYRYAQSKGQGFTGAWMFLLDYSDASSISSWADEAMHWCVMKEIVGGTGSGKLSPQGTATRGQIVTMLYRYFNL